MSPYLEQFKDFLNGKLTVCDVGASPIEDTPVYQSLYDKEMADLVLFEPQPDMYEALKRQVKNGDELYQKALGNGKQHELKLTHAPGMTSIYEPNRELINRLQGYPIWSQIKNRIMIETSRLDDLHIKKCDFMKLDTQGAEFEILSNATETLKGVSVIHTEAYFVPMYHEIPLFSDIDSLLRDNSFFFHSFQNPFIRLYNPLVVNNQFHRGINQWIAADCVYVKDFSLLMELDFDSIVNCLCLLTVIYGSIDLAYRIAKEYDARHDLELSEWYAGNILKS